MKVLVCGSRRFMDPLVSMARLVVRMNQIPTTVTVLHGDAPGVDRAAAKVALDRGMNVIAFPAEWEVHSDGCGCKEGARYCKKAGFRRNLLMLGEQPDLVLAFWNGSSHGTMHTINNARARGIPVEIMLL